MSYNKQSKNILKNVLTELNQKQIDAYETKSLIRFIYGRLFRILNDKISILCVINKYILISNINDFL